MNARIFLKKGKDEAVRRFHPWVFSGAIRNYSTPLSDGEVAEVYSAEGLYLGTGHFQAEASIAVRLFHFSTPAHPKPPLINVDFWIQRLAQALHYRRVAAIPALSACQQMTEDGRGIILHPENNAFRWIHAEGDGLPGLVLDVYDSTAVLQCHTVGMHLQRHNITQAILSVGNTFIRTVYDKSKETLPARYASGLENGWLHGAGSSAVIREHGHSFLIDWEKGQKTGFFLDQRDNRQLLSHYAAGKTVLNAFCYSGGFSVYALKAGASRVVSVDASAKAIEWTKHNLQLNGFSAAFHPAVEADVMNYLENCPEFEVMIVDPPAFAKNLSKRHAAVQGYKRLNVAAMKKLKSRGLLFTFSCSQVVDRQLFYDTIVAAAMATGRQVRVLQHLSQPPDHPVSLFHPEGAYLKGLVLYVE